MEPGRRGGGDPRRSRATRTRRCATASGGRCTRSMTTGRRPTRCTASTSAPPACCGRSTTLRGRGCTSPRHDYARLAGDGAGELPPAARVRRPAPSLWIGEGGIALVAWLLSPAPALARPPRRAGRPRARGRHARADVGQPGPAADRRRDARAHRRGRAGRRRGARSPRTCWAAGASACRTSGPSGSTAPSRSSIGPAHGLAGIVARARPPPGAAAARPAAPRRPGGARRPPRPPRRARELAARARRAARAPRPGRSARSGATGRPASSPRSPRCPATASSTRCCWRAAS